jgi:hypothetical protein
MKGVISFFDILGYRSFLQSNSAIGTAEQVLKFIASVGEETSQILRGVQKDAKNEVRQIHTAVASCSNWIVFSDTIIHTIQFDEAHPMGPLFQGALISEAVFSAALLQNSMFEYGLPTRGVMHFGEFLSHKNCLAGKAVVEAYEQLEKVDLAGVVLTACFLEKIEDFKKLDNGVLEKTLSGQIADFLVPFSDGSEKTMGILNFTNGLWKKQFRDIDIKQLVSEKFWAFGKHISNKVDRKVQNTEKMLRYFRSLESRLGS